MSEKFKLELAKAALQRMRSAKPENPNLVGFEAAAEELYRAAKGDDRGAFASALRNVLRVSREGFGDE